MEKTIGGEVPKLNQSFCTQLSLLFWIAPIAIAIPKLIKFSCSHSKREASDAQPAHEAEVLLNARAAEPPRQIEFETASVANRHSCSSDLCGNSMMKPRAYPNGKGKRRRR